MGDTKKVGSAGRFGSRYGVGIRKRILKVEPKQIQKNNCPNCGAPAIKRKSKGVFYCKKCSFEFVGGAYTTKTLAGGIVSQIVSQKRAGSEAGSEAEAKMPVKEEQKGEENVQVP